MTTEQSEQTAREAAEQLDRRVEVIAAVLLALATLASAWSAYQASLWNGEQTLRLSESNAARTESVRLSNVAQQSVDVDMFVQYAVAVSEKNQAIVDFLYPRFRPEAKVAQDADDNGDRYVRQTVLFAAVLLFSGLATTLDYKPVKIGVLVVGAIVFVVALVATVTTPVQ